MYAVVAVFTLDRAWDEEQQRTVEEQLIPTTRQVPGFVSGYWMIDPAEPKSQVLTIWDTEEQARALNSSRLRANFLPVRQGSLCTTISASPKGLRY